MAQHDQLLEIERRLDERGQRGHVYLPTADRRRGADADVVDGQRVELEPAAATLELPTGLWR